MRAAGAAVLAAFVVFTSPGGVEAAKSTATYRPTFVTQREAGAWQDCMWASAAMFLDKWTSGSRIVGREKLRKLSGDEEGGSNLSDLRRAFDALGLSLETSPGAGSSIGWPTLLKRLAAGSGAIVLGDYGKLPARYGRWDREFWAKTETGDDHAMYFDRYDRRTGRILVMDPLAPAGWHGEWIPVSVLKKFAWRTSGGALWAAVTPKPQSFQAFEGVAFSSAAVGVDGQGIHASWRIEGAPRGWMYRGAGVTSEVTAMGVIDPNLPTLLAPGLRALLAAGLVQAPDLVQAPGAVRAPEAVPANTLSSPVVAAADGRIEIGLPRPAAPGTYRLTIGLTEPGTGRTVASAGPFSLYVPGPTAASLVVPTQLEVAAGERASFPVIVTNTGSLSWADPAQVAWLPIAEQQGPDVHVIGRWVAAAPEAPAGPGPALTPLSEGVPFLSSTTDVAGTGHPAFEPPPTGQIDLGRILLDSGDQATVVAEVQAPASPGAWRLVFEVTEAGRSLAVAGSAPGIVAVNVLAGSEDALPS
jgi:hypothetical protein